MNAVKQPVNQPTVTEYNFLQLNKWPDSEWKKDYPEAAAFMKSLLMNAKLKFDSLIPLLQLLKPTACIEPIKHLSTDGKHLFFYPKYIKGLLKKNPSEKVEEEYMRELLHIVMHGFLGNFDAYYEDTELSWSIMDLLAERFATLYLPDTKEAMPPFFEDEKSKRQLENKRRLEALLKKGMGAYHVIRPMKRSRAYIIKEGLEKRRDNHHIWNAIYQEDWQKAIEEVLSVLSPELKEKLRKAKLIQVGELKNINALPGPIDMDSNLIISVIADSKRRSHQFGMGEGGMTQEFTPKDSPKQSYTDLLKKLCTEEEAIRDIPDSIDPMLYQYGLDLYGNIPLIEPLEENPNPELKNLVFAIDTSGSCSGYVAERFVSETKKILKDAAIIGNIGPITLIDCDFNIQNVREFENGEEMLDAFSRPVMLQGFGGTSFVPVFDWIKENKTKKGVPVTALIYLTDGEGLYPEEKPDYPTYFVMPQQDVLYSGVESHPWIEVVTLDMNNEPLF